MSARQDQAPYLQALCAYAAREPARLHVPGHKGGPGADPQLLEAIGERALSLDIPALTYGVDIGPEPTPFEQAQRLAAQAWGAERAWFLVNGASQGNLAAGLALAHSGDEVVVQRNAHSSAVDALVLSGLRPTFAAPELDPELGIAHCLSAQTLDMALAQTPGAVGAWVVSPTYFGAVADVRALADAPRARPLADEEDPTAEDLSLATLERRQIEKVLVLYDGNQTRAAEALGLSVRTLYRKVRELGLREHGAR